jgi:hypothetical protein
VLRRSITKASGSRVSRAERPSIACLAYGAGRAYKPVLDRESFLPFYNYNLNLKPVTMTSTPNIMQAIKIVSAGKAEIQSVPLPKLLDHYILVKVTAVAINPTDW